MTMTTTTTTTTTTTSLFVFVFVFVPSFVIWYSLRPEWASSFRRLVAPLLLVVCCSRATPTPTPTYEYYEYYTYALTYTNGERAQNTEKSLSRQLRTGAQLSPTRVSRSSLPRFLAFFHNRTRQRGIRPTWPFDDTATVRPFCSSPVHHTAAFESNWISRPDSS